MGAIPRFRRRTAHTCLPAPRGDQSPTGHASPVWLSGVPTTLLWSSTHLDGGPPGVPGLALNEHFGDGAFGWVTSCRQQVDVARLVIFDRALGQRAPFAINVEPGVVDQV